MFDFFPFLFGFMFVFVFVFIAVVLIKMLLQWNKNNRSPRLTVNATVVSKRMQVTTHHHDMGNAASHIYNSACYDETSYYVTFQVESGDRMELCVGGLEYGQLVEGDFGRLSFQGTRYLGFERTEEIYENH